MHLKTSFLYGDEAIFYYAFRTTEKMCFATKLVYANVNLLYRLHWTMGILEIHVVNNTFCIRLETVADDNRLIEIRDLTAVKRSLSYTYTGGLQPYTYYMCLSSSCSRRATIDIKCIYILYKKIGSIII